MNAPVLLICAAFSAISNGMNWASLQVRETEIRNAIYERWVACEKSAGSAVSAYVEGYAAAHNYAGTTGRSFPGHQAAIEDMIASGKWVDHTVLTNAVSLEGDDEIPLMTNLVTFRAIAGIHSSGFRRATDYDPSVNNWADPNDAMYSYGTGQVGDVVGPWLIDDLHKALSAMKWTWDVSYDIGAVADADKRASWYSTGYRITGTHISNGWPDCEIARSYCESNWYDGVFTNGSSLPDAVLDLEKIAIIYAAPGVATNFVSTATSVTFTAAAQFTAPEFRNDDCTNTLDMDIYFKPRTNHVDRYGGILSNVFVNFPGVHYAQGEYGGNTLAVSNNLFCYWETLTDKNYTSPVFGGTFTGKTWDVVTDWGTTNVATNSFSIASWLAASNAPVSHADVACPAILDHPSYDFCVDRSDCYVIQKWNFTHSN